MLPDLKELGKRIREARKKRGLTQLAAADRLGISRAYMGQIERGEANVSYGIVRRTCAIFRVPVHADQYNGTLLTACVDAYRETQRARMLFPQPNALMAALTEEVGEVAKALLDRPLDEVRQEAIQVAAMGLRVATEGDPTLDPHRASKGLKPSADLACS